MPSVLMAERFADRIFAPKDLFLALADGLVARGHTVYVYSTSNTQTKGTLITGDPILEKQMLHSVKIRKLAGSQLEFRLNATEYESDIAGVSYKHAKANGVEVMHLYMDSIAHYWAESSVIPTVMTIHDPLFPPDTLEGWRYRRFRRLPHVAISARQKDIYGPDFNIVDVVYHGLNLATFPVGNSDKGYLAFVGRLIPEKGIEDALQASQATGLPLHIATSENYLDTDYYTSTLKPLITAAGATMTGFMQNRERNDWMKSARAVVCPIHWEEPFGMVMIEAMACGTPVIAYNRGSVSEIVKDGVTGFIIDPDDTDRPGKGSWKIKTQGVAGLVEAIKKIDQIDRAACRKHVEEKFTIEKMVDGYEQVYKKILSKQSA